MHQSGPYWAAAVVSAFTAVFAAIFVAIQGIPALGPGFWSALGIELVLEAVAIVLFCKALEKPLKIGKVSLACTSGILAAASSIALGYALAAGSTPCVISIRRLRAPLTVFLGGKFLKEKDNSQRF